MNTTGHLSVSGALRRVVLRWAGHGLWAITDQGLFATANFVHGVLLARWLSPEEYGAFALVYALFLLFGMVHTSLLTEPMLVFGSSKHAHDFPAYLRVLRRAHWSLTRAGMVLFAFCSVGFWLLGSIDLAKSFFGVAVASPFILLTWLLRRACFACFQPKLAAVGGVVHFALMVAGTVLLAAFEALSPLSALLMLGASSFVAASWLLQGLRSSAHAREPSESEHAVWRDHWEYGRWALATSVLSWAAGNVYMFILPLVGGLSATAAFRALLNLVLPMLQANVALAALLLPALSRTRGQRRFRTLVATATAGFAGMSVLYWVVLVVFSERIVDLLYGGQYVQYAHLVVLVGLLPTLSGVGVVLSNTLRALERPDRVFWAYLGSTIVALTVGPLAVAYSDVRGAVLGQISSLLATICILVFVLLHEKGARVLLWGSEHPNAKSTGAAGATNTL